VTALYSYLLEEVGNSAPLTAPVTWVIRRSTGEGRDITILINLEHARRRICNAVNVDFLADIATQTKATKLEASRFEEHSPQYLLYI